MIKVIAINFGFAEDGQIGTVFYTSQHGFQTEREACLDLAKSLFEEFKREEEYCAKSYYPRDKNGHYLRDENGHMIKASREPDLSEEAFITYLVNIGLSTCDSYAPGEISWWPWHSFRDILEFDKKEFCILDSRTLHEGRPEDFLSYLVFEDKHLERIKACKLCGGVGFKCTYLRTDGTHATIKDEHSVWHCCAPFWDRVTKEIKQQATEICDSKRKELGL